MTPSLTVLDWLVAALQHATTYNSNEEVAPVAILWPDQARQWEPLLPLLRAHLPVYIFDHNRYQPDEGRGPAYWLRCIVDRTIDGSPPEGVIPILYLPGISNQDLYPNDACPDAVKPLAELQYRGDVWARWRHDRYRTSWRDWTVADFLHAPQREGGLEITLDDDEATQAALLRALSRLAQESVAALRSAAPLRAVYFDALVLPSDEGKTLLEWLDQPDQGHQMEDAVFAAFTNQCQARYNFHPEQDGKITAARLLGQRQGPWAVVWVRFAEMPSSYPRIHALLRQACPQPPPSLAEGDAWPQVNEDAETALRAALTSLASCSPAEARARLIALDAEHGPRRAWLWARLDQAPLARALEPLAALARTTERPLGGLSVLDITTAYTTWGWQADAALLDARAAVDQAPDIAAIKAAALVLYQPWLLAAAEAFQKAVTSGSLAKTYATASIPALEPGDCLLFSDGLRFDVAQRLLAELERRGLTCQIDSHLAALPSVTPTAKPAVSPVAGLLTGGPKNFDTLIQATKTQVTADTLRNLLTANGYQPLADDDLGDPHGKGWTECGDIDKQGHPNGWKVARILPELIREIANRVEALLRHGWSRVTIVTDHGWLLLPGGLPKSPLPEHLTLARKGRCARLKEGTTTEYHTVPWHWDNAVSIALAPDIHCFEAGKEYEHGGLSPQECITPVLTVSQGGGTAPVAPPSIRDHSWRGLRCTIHLTNSRPGLHVDIRIKPGDPRSTLIGDPKLVKSDGSGSVIVEDESNEGIAAVIVVLTADGAICAQTHTTIGGE